jgi:hypothetical protein
MIVYFLFLAIGLHYNEISSVNFLIHKILIYNFAGCTVLLRQDISKMLFRMWCSIMWDIEHNFSLWP